MLARDVSKWLTRGLIATTVVGTVVCCGRKPKPTPTKVTHSPLTGVGGQPNAAEANMGGAPSPTLTGEYAASLAKVSKFTAAPGKFVKVPYTGKTYDEKGQYEEAKNRFKAAAAQAYHVCAALESTGGDFEMSLYVNGARESAIANSFRGAAQGCGTANLKAGDLLEVWVEAAGAAAQFEPSDFADWLTIDPWQTIAHLSSIEPVTAPPSAFTVVPYSTPLPGLDSQFDPHSRSFTAATPGDYHVCAALASTAGDFELDLAINGNRENPIAVSSHGAASGCRTVRLSKGQTVDVRVHHESKEPMKFEPKKFWNWMTVSAVPARNTSRDSSMDNSNAFDAPPNAHTKVPYVNKLYDDGSLFDVQTSRFTASKPHDYRVCGSMASLSKDFELDLFVNGTREKRLGTGRAGIARGCRTVRLNKAGDFLEIFIHHRSDAPLHLDTNQFWNWLTVEPAHW